MSKVSPLVDGPINAFQCLPGVAKISSAHGPKASFGEKQGWY